MLRALNKMESVTNTIANETDVLIVGAGPVGLFLANECARRGMRWRLIEESAGQSAHSKALAIFPRTLEIFDMAGLVAPFLDRANRVTKVAVAAHQHELAEIRFEPEETPYPYIAMVPQNVTESLLVEELERKGGRVEYETAFVSAEQHDDFVTVIAAHKGEAVSLWASYVVGCDGAHSRVRKGLQVPLEGGDYRDEFMLADLETNEFRPPDELQLCPSESGPVALFPMSARRWRMVATIEEPEGEAPGLELVKRILQERTSVGVEARELNWSSYFHIHHRHAGRLRVGRVLIAGDAAHLHSPFGGQGMNTGLHDAWNLVWKLDLVLRGHGNDGLLESYAAERLPVIRSVIETTDFLTKAMGISSKIAQLVRDAVIPAVSHLSAFQHAFVQRLSGLGIAYHGSAIIEGAGERWFDDAMRGGGIRSCFLLLLGSDAEAATIDAAERLSKSFGDVVELRKGAGHGIQLVRPDGYLAYCADGANSGRAWDAVRSLLEKQTR